MTVRTVAISSFSASLLWYRLASLPVDSLESRATESTLFTYVLELLLLLLLLLWCMRANPRIHLRSFTTTRRGDFGRRGGCAPASPTSASSWIVVALLSLLRAPPAFPPPSWSSLLRWNSSSSSVASASSLSFYASSYVRPFGIYIIGIGATAAFTSSPKPLLPPTARRSRQTSRCFFSSFSSSSTSSSSFFSSSTSGSLPDMPSTTAIAPTASTTSTSNNNNNLRFADIGANLLDDRFIQGVYRGTFRHEPDVPQLMERAVNVGVKRIVLTAGTLEDSQLAVQTVREWRTRYPQIQWSCTIGIHPTRCQQEFVDSSLADHDVLAQLLLIAQDGMTDQSVSAIGEIGLDYDRLEFCSKDVQHTYLRQQLRTLAKPTGLPLFLHNRSAQSDLIDILRDESDCWQNSGGVVHSFDDTLELASQFVALGLYIGLNGCSLKTLDNLNVVRSLPLGKILLETDAPYCEIRSTHAGYSNVQTHFPAKPEKKFELGMCVKGRQEPCHILQVAQVVAGTKDVPLEVVADACYRNTCRLFGWPEEDTE